MNCHGIPELAPIDTDAFSDEIRLEKVIKQGLDQLSGIDFIYLCPSLSDQQPLQLWDTLQHYADDRDAILIVDPPLAIESFADVNTWYYATPQLHKKHVAIYFPAIEWELNNVEIEKLPKKLPSEAPFFIGAGASVCGLFNRFDESQGVWHAPTGTNARIHGAISPRSKLSNAETLELMNMGINCIREFKTTGTVVWGTSTALGLNHPNMYWKYIHVRRTLFFIRKSISESAKWVNGVSSDFSIEAALNAMVEPFLLELYTRGVFAGKTIKDSYYFVCEKTDSGYELTLGLALLKPSEFIVQKNRIPHPPNQSN